MDRRDKTNYYLDLADVVSKRCTCGGITVLSSLKMTKSFPPDMLAHPGEERIALI